MKTAISLPDELFEDAEQLAARLGMARSQLYATALAEFVAKHQASSVTEALNRVYGDIDATAELPPRAAARRAFDRSEWT